MRFSDVSIKSRLSLVVVLPIIAVIFLGGQRVLSLNGEVESNQNLVDVMGSSIAASQLVHEIQKERGLSVGYLGSKGEKFGSDLQEQRKNVDARRDAFHKKIKQLQVARFGEDYAQAVERADKELLSLPEMRKKVDSLALEGPAAAVYFTGVNSLYLAVIQQSLAAVRDPGVFRSVSAYSSLLLAKEQAGLERATGITGFGAGWTPAVLDRFSGIVKLQDSYLSLFRLYASAPQRDVLSVRMKDPVFADIQKMRDIAYASSANAGETAAVELPVWVEKMTRKINLFKEVEDSVAADVEGTSRQLYTQAKTEGNIYLVLIVGGLLFIIALVYAVVSDLLRNIRATQGVMLSLSDGTDDMVISGQDRKDEIGGMARSLEHFRLGLAEKKRLEAGIHDRERRAGEERHQMMKDLVSRFNEDVGGCLGDLLSASSSLQSAAIDMKEVANQTSVSSQTVAAASEQASVNVGTVASAMEEVSASSAEITTQVTQVRTKSNDTAENARRANETISNLNGLVSTIGEVVVSIQGIAEQTNLLALNATIEAARAGESGKGFAVVADEVKKLATETAHKTSEIGKQIHEIQQATANSVAAMGRILGNISEIDSYVVGVSAAVEEQNATTSEIARSLSEASSGSRQVSQVILDVQRKAASAGESAGVVLGAAENVAALSTRMRESVAQFLGRIAT